VELVNVRNNAIVPELYWLRRDFSSLVIHDSPAELAIDDSFLDEGDYLLHVLVIPHQDDLPIIETFWPSTIQKM
jgi:hypothetical protein